MKTKKVILIIMAILARNDLMAQTNWNQPVYKPEKDDFDSIPFFSNQFNTPNILFGKSYRDSIENKCVQDSLKAIQKKKKRKK